MNTNSLTRTMFACLLGMAAASGAKAQTLAQGRVAVDSVVTRMADDHVDIAFRLNLDRLTLKPEQQLVFTPMLTAGNDTVALAPVIVNGRSQQLRYERNRRRAAAADGKQPIVVRRRNGQPQSVDYRQTVHGFQPAADGSAQLLTAEDLCGCGRLAEQDRTPIARLEQPQPEMPALAFVRPAAEARKQRAEKGEAYLSFRVNKTDIVADLFENATELAKITKTIDLVRDDKNVEITGIDIHGYASPDGPYANNERLARERAASLKNYVASLYDINPKLFTSSSTPEDWDGFRRKVSASQLPHKAELLAIANSDLQPDAKDQKMRRAYPQDYAVITRDIYPRLRHSDYTVSYTVRPFSVDEAKQVLKTHPQQLSLEEMFLVAQTMEPGSAEFNEVFDIAVRLFPDDPTANLNAACADLQRGDTAAAERHLQKAGQSAEALNARGALAAQRKDYAAARELYQKAANAGSTEAKQNLQRIANRK